MSPQRSGCSIRRRFKWFGRSLEGPKYIFSPPKTALTAHHIIQRSGTRWPTIGPTSSFMHSPRSSWSHRSSGKSGNKDTRSSWWPPFGKTNLVVRADSAAGSSPLADEGDEISSLKRTGQYGTLGLPASQSEGQMSLPILAGSGRLRHHRFVHLRYWPIVFITVKGFLV